MTKHCNSELFDVRDTIIAPSLAPPDCLVPFPTRTSVGTTGGNCEDGVLTSVDHQGFPPLRRLDRDTPEYMHKIYPSKSSDQSMKNIFIYLIY